MAEPLVHISGLQSERVHVLQWADAHETDLSHDEAEEAQRNWRTHKDLRNRPSCWLLLCPES